MTKPSVPILKQIHQARREIRFLINEIKTKKHTEDWVYPSINLYDKLLKTIDLELKCQSEYRKTAGFLVDNETDENSTGGDDMILEKEIKRVYRILINPGGLRVDWLDENNEEMKWIEPNIFAKDFRITGTQFGEKAGVIKIEIGD